MSTAITIRNERLRVLPVDVINIILKYVSHLEDSLWSLQFNVSTGDIKHVVNKYYMPLVKSLSYKYEYNQPQHIHAQVLDKRNNGEFYMSATLTLIKETSDDGPCESYYWYVYQLEGIEVAYNNKGELVPIEGSTNAIQMQFTTEVADGARRKNCFTTSYGSATVHDSQHFISNIVQSGCEELSPLQYIVPPGFDYTIIIF